jgi:hypothetical protein
LKVELEILNRKGEQMIKINVTATTTIKQVTELFKTHYKKQVIKIISGKPKNPKPQNPSSIFQAKVYRVKAMGVPYI